MHFFFPSQTAITLFLLAISSAALGQVTTVTGQVKDVGNRLVSFSNVLLIQAQHSESSSNLLIDPLMARIQEQSYA
jgi:hypothetical protein